MDTGFYPSTYPDKGSRYRVLPLNLPRYRVQDTGLNSSTYPDAGFKIPGSTPKPTQIHAKKYKVLQSTYGAGTPRIQDTNEGLKPCTEEIILEI